MGSTATNDGAAMFDGVRDPTLRVALGAEAPGPEATVPADAGPTPAAQPCGVGTAPATPAAEAAAHPPGAAHALEPAGSPGARGNLGTLPRWPLHVPGTPVVVTGLRAKPQFNSRVGVVRGPAPKHGRLLVLLDGDDTPMSFSEANLRKAVPLSDTKEEELYDAALDGNVSYIKALLDAGADVDARMASDRGREWTCPLIAAAYNGHAEAVSLLFAHGADVTAETEASKAPLDRRCAHEAGCHCGRTRLYWWVANALTAAADQGHLDVIKVICSQPILDTQVDVTVAIAPGTPVHTPPGTPQSTLGAVAAEAIEPGTPKEDEASDGDAATAVGAPTHVETHTNRVESVVTLHGRPKAKARRRTRSPKKAAQSPGMAAATHSTPAAESAESAATAAPTTDTAAATLAGTGGEVPKELAPEAAPQDAPQDAAPSATTDPSATAADVADAVAAAEPGTPVHTPPAIPPQSPLEEIVQVTLRHVVLEQPGSERARNPTPLMQACLQGKAAVVKYLLDSQGASVATVKTERGLTALKCAVMGSHADCTQLLLEHGAEPDDLDKPDSCCDGDYDSALRIAVVLGDTASAALLINHGASLGARAQRDCCVGKTPLMAAGKYGRKDIAELIIKAAADRGVSSTLNDVRRAKDAGDEGPSALTLAAEFGHFDTAKVFLESGAAFRVETKTASYDRFGFLQEWVDVTTTALIACVLGLRRARGCEGRGAVDVGSLSKNLERDADPCWDLVDVGDAYGSEQDYIDLIAMLCDHNDGEMLDMTDNFKLSALIIAAEDGNAEAVEVMLDKLAAKGATKMGARAQAHLNHVYPGRNSGQCGGSTFCNCGADKVGGSALARAAAKGHTKMVKTLLGRGAKVDDQTHTETCDCGVPCGYADAPSAFVHAAAGGFIDTALVLFNAGASIEAKSNSGEGKTAVFYAVDNLQSTVLELLMELGADADAQIDQDVYVSNFGLTPLMVAAQMNETETVRRLLSYGVDRMKTATCAPKEGHRYDNCTARDFAMFANHPECKKQVTYSDKEYAKDLDVRAANHMAFMNSIYPEGAPRGEYSSARFAIESRHHRELCAGLRHCYITFEPNDPGGANLTVAASTVASWPGAPPVCNATLAIAKAVESVALVGWKADSPWSPTTNWLQPGYVKELAVTVLLCVQRGMCKLTLPDVPAEIQHLIIGKGLGRDTARPQGMAAPEFAFRSDRSREIPRMQNRGSTISFSSEQLPSGAFLMNVFV